MAIPFDRQEVRNWEKLNDNFSIDFKYTIGRGSYGIVYRGYSRAKDTLVAIKVIQSTKASVREIETLKALSSLDHPNIMGFYGEIELNGNIFLILEYCNRGTLADLIQEGISEIRVLKLFREMVEGMCYMNAREKMHRDFKPDNILIGPEMDIKICDFGLAQTTNSIFVTGKMGTPLYAGPEVFLIHDRESQTYSYNCDVWSAGLILYEMLMGERLFKNVNNYTQLKEEWLMYERGLKKAVLKPSMHPLWEYFINWMMQFDYKRRPTFHQVLENLKLVYASMHDSLSIFKPKAKMLEELKMEQADCFISFQVAKHQVLVSLCEKFTKEDIRISNEYKFICMFFCLLRYTHFARDFIRALRYKRLRVDNHDLLPAGDQPQVMMFCDRTRFPLEQRYEFYNNQLRNTVVAKIREKYAKRPQSQIIMNSLSQAVQVVESFHKGEQNKDSGELKAIFKDVIAKLRKGRDVRNRFNDDEMRLYVHLLITAQLDEQFPEENYERTNVDEQMGKLAKMTRAELEKQIERLYTNID